LGRLKTGFLIFVGVFAVYAYTAYPTVAPRDSADLAAAALTISAAHPPGYPLYALLGKAWLTLLPWGDPAYRLNLMSAAAGAGCVAAVFILLARSCGFWPGLAAALALAFSAPLWKFSLLCEMYSLHALFLAVLLLLAPGPGQEGRSLTCRAAPSGKGEHSPCGDGALLRAALSALLSGLALVNHQAFILAAPGLAVLWRRELALPGGRRHLLRVCLPLFLLGLGLYVFLWVRTGDLGRAWAILARKEYGTWQLSAGFSRPLTGELALRLMGYFCAELWRGTSPVTVALALLGVWELGRRQPRFGLGLGLIFLGFGPAFFLMTRFDLSGWVARTVLESALVAPMLPLCAAAGFGLAWLRGRWPRAAPILTVAVAAGSLWSNAAQTFHRDDFCAYDYVKDLRRALPPGSAAVAAGDTALYATRYLDLTRPDGRGRRLINFQDRLAGERPGFVLGLSLKNFARLGLASAGGLSPAGLVQSLGPGGLGSYFWDLSVLRQGHAVRLQESYDRDVLLAYAFAHYLSGTLLDSRQDIRATRHYLEAAALDPEDYHIDYKTAR